MSNKTTFKPEEYKELVEHSTELISLHDLDGIYLFASPFSEDLLGYLPSELVGQNPYDYFHPDDLANVEHSHHSIQASGQKARVEYRFRHKNGSYVWVETTSKVIAETDDTPGKIIANTRSIEERKGIELRLIESKARLKLSQSVARIGHYVFDVQTGIWSSSQTLDGIFGIGPEYDRSIQGWLNIIRSDYQHDMQAYLMDEVLGNQVMFDRIYPIQNQASGTTFWVHGLGKLETDNQGKIIRMFGTIQDITERKHAEEMLIKQKYYLEKAQELGRLGSWELDIENNILVWTEENCRIFGVPSGSIVNYEIFIDKVHPEDREYVSREWSAAMQGKPYDIEHRINIAGRVRWVREKAEVSFDSKGDAVSAIGFTQDITERKQLEEQAKENEDRFTGAFEFASIGMAILSTDGVFIKVNKALCDMLGYSEEAFLSLSFMDITYPEDLTADMDNVRKMLCGEINTYQMEKRYVDKQGRLVWGLLNVSLVTDNRDQPKYFISQILEITKRKQLEKELVAMDSLKNEFISTAAHELRTPLSAIMGFAEILLSPELSSSFNEEQKKEYLGDIYNKGEALNRIVDDLLDISRIESGKQIPLDLQENHLGELLTKSSDYFRLAYSRHIFKLKLPKESEQRKLMIDFHRINQVIDNLVSNAVKYSPEETEITIAAESDIDGWTIKVKDQGIGMTPEQVGRIFDRFYRADSSNTAASGLGLGMGIAKQIVEAHGGDLWVESIEGKGTTATFNLPYMYPGTKPA